MSRVEVNYFLTLFVRYADRCFQRKAARQKKTPGRVPGVDRPCVMAYLGGCENSARENIRRRSPKVQSLPYGRSSADAGLPRRTRLESRPAPERRNRECGGKPAVGTGTFRETALSAPKSRQRASPSRPGTRCPRLPRSLELLLGSQEFPQSTPRPGTWDTGEIEGLRLYLNSSSTSAFF